MMEIDIHVISMVRQGYSRGDCPIKVIISDLDGVADGILSNLPDLVGIASEQTGVVR
jgi:hypothetical protein